MALCRLRTSSDNAMRRVSSRPLPSVVSRRSSPRRKTFALPLIWSVLYTIIMQGRRLQFMQRALQSERARKQAEQDAQEARDQANEYTAQNGSLLASKRKAESELAALHVSAHVMNPPIRNGAHQMFAADFRRILTKRSTNSAVPTITPRRRWPMRRASPRSCVKSRYALFPSPNSMPYSMHSIELKEHSMHVERMRQSLEAQIKDLQVRLDDAEQVGCSAKYDSPNVVHAI